MIVQILVERRFGVTAEREIIYILMCEGRFDSENDGLVRAGRELIDSL